MADGGGTGRRQTGRRWLWVVAGVAAIGAVCAVAGIWHLPDRMYTDQAARAALQGGLLTAAAALTAVAGGLVALDETRQANAETRRANEAADGRERSANANAHVRELYVAAIGMLGADTVDVRLGGIYALERIAVDSPPDQRTVVEVLSAFVREHSRPPVAVAAPRPPPGRRWDRAPARDRHRPDEQAARPSTDVQAAVTVLGRLPALDGVPRADLTGARLVGAAFDGADLTGAELTGADLTRAQLYRADLTRADLGSANLSRAVLTSADLTRADLEGADLTRAELVSADLTGAELGSTDLTGAELGSTDLTGAELGSTDLTGAELGSTDLTGALLSGADLTGAALDGADLTGAWLHSADLTPVSGLTGEQLAVAAGDEWTRLPVGVPRPAAWPPAAPDGPSA